MRESELKIEWLFINLRWFFLTAVAGVVGIDAAVHSQPFPRTVLVLLSVGAVGNLIEMVAKLQTANFKGYPTLMLLQDIALTVGFIAASGGPSSPVLFTTLIPIITTALRFSTIASVLMAMGAVVAYLAVTWNQLGLNTSLAPRTLVLQMLPYLINSLVLLVAGGAISDIGSRIKQMLIEERNKQEKEAIAAVEAAHQRIRLIFELASTLSATLNYEHVLEAALDVSNAGLREFTGRDIPQIGMILLFGMDQTLYIVKSRSLAHQDERLRFPSQEGALAESLNKAEPVICYDPRNDPELGRMIAMQYCQEVIVLPLRAGFESYGALVLGSPEPDTYTVDFQDLLVAVCNQAVMALQNATLYRNLIEEKEKLVAVEEDARKRLARDLHDGPTQTIAAIAMRLNYIRLLLKKDLDQSLKEIKELEDLARKTTKEIRQMLFTLRPLILETQGLIAALEQYIIKLAETDPLPIHLEADKEAGKRLSKEAQGSVFYIVEEAITNARKHAQAQDLWVRIYKQGSNVITEIEDNGRGFDVAATEANYDKRGSLGMMNLQERAELVGGNTVIRSKVGEGTKIIVNIPVKAEAIESGD
ncbi:MAG: GAF domain-containing sensor histidine kinase [Anaerolineae bacterium]|nr:GAF domain-containing sensor histidine kinase [Anaerolineae bacterium]